MILTKLELQDFGVYAGYHEIDLEPPSLEKPIILFGGLNGAGKTTILEAVQLALYGTRTPTVKREGLSYDEYLTRCIHSSSPPHEGAAIRLTFRLRTDGSNRVVQVRRNWYQKSRSVRETEEVFVGDSMETLEFDSYLSEHWAEYIDGVVPIGVAPLFFFDADRIEGFADLANSGELIRTAIHGLLGLDLVDRLAIDLRVLERRKAGREAKREHRDALDRVEQELAALETDWGSALERVESLGSRRTHVAGELAGLEEQFRKDGGDLFVERASIEAELERLRSSKVATEEELRRIAAGPAPLLLVVDLLEEIRKEDELDKRRESTEVLERTLNERDRAVIALLNEREDPELSKTVEEFLETDREARLADAGGSPVYGLSASTRTELRRLLDSGFGELRDDVDCGITALGAVHADLDEVDRRLEGVPEKDTISALLRARGECRSRLAELDRSLMVATEELERLGRDRERKELEFQRLQRRVADQAWANEAARRIVKYSEIARGNLSQFRARVLERNLRRIEQLILQSFQELLRKEGLVASLSIDPEDLGIRLFGASGRLIHPDRLSAGERQLLAVSILWGLARASQRLLPTIVDTPLGRLDSVHRAHLVSRYFPNASHQVVLLSTDEEIDEAHLRQIGDFVGRSYRLEYDDARGCTTPVPGYFESAVPI